MLKPPPEHILRIKPRHIAPPEASHINELSPLSDSAGAYTVGPSCIFNEGMMTSKYMSPKVKALQ